MKTVWAVVLLVVATGVAFAAEESFESKILAKETAQVYGNGTLSAATTVYTIVVSDQGTTMRIDLSKQAFDLLHEGDEVRITIERGWFSVQIRGIKLLRLAEETPRTSGGTP